jgi:hypothetical protein
VGHPLEIKHYQEKWLQHKQRMDFFYVTQKDEYTQDDRGRDTATNFILRIKELETHLIFPEHDDDDDDDDDGENLFVNKFVRKRTYRALPRGRMESNCTAIIQLFS